MKVAVIDLGFNSVKLVNYEVSKGRSFRPYQQEGVKVRLGEGLPKTGNLGREQIDRTIKALRVFRDIINFDTIRHVLPVATSAVREAGNREAFLQKVRSETGFVFKVLSEEEESLYSYIGALRANCLPTTLFFDLGGGSLEIVYTENYNVRRTRSFPLGALRLSQVYGRGDGTFSNKNYARLLKHIRRRLPAPAEFPMSPDTTLVGVGGVLRAMARYDQDVREYALDKIHKYEMGIVSVAAARDDFVKMDSEELLETEAIGCNRVETVAAGATIIHSLMKQYAFEKVVVSAQGLREGILSVFLRDPKMFYKGGINSNKARAHVTFACQTELLPEHTVTLVRPLVNASMLREKERMILTHAIKQVESLPIVTNLNNLFYLMIDEDSPFLSHREQLILAISIIHTRKAKAADWLISRYRSILEPQNKGSIQKISACLVMSAILERGRINAKLSIRQDDVDMKLYPTSSRQFVPYTLLADALRKFEQAFDVTVDCTLVDEKGGAAAPGKPRRRVLAA